MKENTLVYAPVVAQLVRIRYLCLIVELDINLLLLRYLCHNLDHVAANSTRPTMNDIHLQVQACFAKLLADKLRVEYLEKHPGARADIQRKAFNLREQALHFTDVNIQVAVVLLLHRGEPFQIVWLCICLAFAAVYNVNVASLD